MCGEALWGPTGLVSPGSPTPDPMVSHPRCRAQTIQHGAPSLAGDVGGGGGREQVRGRESFSEEPRHLHAEHWPLIQPSKSLPSPTLCWGHGGLNRPRPQDALGLGAGAGNGETMLGVCNGSTGPCPDPALAQEPPWGEGVGGRGGSLPSPRESTGL